MLNWHFCAVRSLLLMLVHSLIHLVRSSLLAMRHSLLFALGAAASSSHDAFDHHALYRFHTCECRERSKQTALSYWWEVHAICMDTRARFWVWNGDWGPHRTRVHTTHVGDWRALSLPPCRFISMLAPMVLVLATSSLRCIFSRHARANAYCQSVYI